MECEEIFQNTIPYCYQPNRLFYPNTQSEKIFASCWIGEDKVAIGTKDNQLSIWNIHENTIKQLSLPYTSITFDKGCGIHDIDYNSYGNNGIMITGSDNPNEIALFETNLFQSIGLLKGHNDWVFGCKFISDNVIFSGSKDGTVRFWKLDKVFRKYQLSNIFIEKNSENEYSNQIPIIKPYHQCSGNFDKIRCISVDRNKQLCYSLNTNGSVTIWNSEIMIPIHQEILDDYFELITMDNKENDNLIAVGSRSYTSLIDTRIDGDVTSISHVDVNWGVRKVMFLDNYLIIGGGSGIVSFVDMRKYDSFKHIIYHQCHGIVRNRYINVNENDIPQAVYTISHNPSKTNLFVGGGPLLADVSGYFGSIWN